MLQKGGFAPVRVVGTPWNLSQLEIAVTQAVLLHLLQRIGIIKQLAIEDSSEVVINCITPIVIINSRSLIILET